MNKIYCIGNSHTHFFVAQHPSVDHKWHSYNYGDIIILSMNLGPYTARNCKKDFLNNTYKILSTTSLDKQNDYIMLVLGEIDCRWYLLHQAEIQSRPVIDIIHECVDRYFECIIDLISNGYGNMIIWGVHPSTNLRHNPDGPIYGEVQCRNITTQQWNEYIEQLCKNHNIYFASIFHELINNDITTKNDCFRDDNPDYNDCVHLNYKHIILALEKIRTTLNIKTLT